MGLGRRTGGYRCRGGRHRHVLHSDDKERAGKSDSLVDSTHWPREPVVSNSATCLLAVSCLVTVVSRWRTFTLNFTADVLMWAPSDVAVLKKPATGFPSPGRRRATPGSGMALSLDWEKEDYVPPFAPRGSSSPLWDPAGTSSPPSLRTVFPIYEAISMRVLNFPAECFCRYMCVDLPSSFSPLGICLGHRWGCSQRFLHFHSHASSQESKEALHRRRCSVAYHITFFFSSP